MAGPSAIRDAIAAAREFAADAGIMPTDAAKLAIIVEELVANLYDHGALGDDDAVEIELAASPTSVTLSVNASGAPFHPGALLADAEVPERGGGVGLKLVQAWSLSIDQEHVHGRNIWTIVLPVGDRR